MAKLGDPASNEQKSERAFWSKLVDRIAGKASGQKSNIIMAGAAINCYLDETDPGTANLALYEIADTVPGWGMAYAGGKAGDFYGSYHAWVEQLHPPTLDPNAAKQLKDVQAKIANYTSGIQKIKLAYFKEYMDANCLQPSADGATCSAWMPSSGLNDFAASWKMYQGGPEYAAKVNALTTEAGMSLSGLQEQFNTLAQQAFGAGFQTLQEAQAAADLADTSITTRTDAQQKQAALAQMATNQKGATIYVPRYICMPSQKDYAQWVQTAKTNFQQGVPPVLQFQITQSDHETDTTSYQFSGGVCFPVCDIFMGSGSTSGSGTTVNINNYDFTATVTYQDLIFVSCDPSSTWYNGSILSLYAQFKDFPPGSQFLSPPAKVCPPFGKDGALPMRVSGFYVAYRSSVKLSITNFNQFKQDTQWTESASCSLFGLFSVGSESVSHQYSKLEVTTYADGFEYTDTSEIPKIIALEVELIGQPSLAF